MDSIEIKEKIDSLKKEIKVLEDKEWEFRKKKYSYLIGKCLIKIPIVEKL